MDNAAIAIATISAVATIIGGGFATWQQLRKDARANNVELVRLQEDIEKELWARTRAEFAVMSKRIDELEAAKRELSETVSSQGTLMMHMRKEIEDLKQDRDHWQRRALEAEKKTGQ